MPGQEEQPENSLAAWRQGDYALNVGGLLFADASDAGDEGAYSANEEIEKIVGLMAISQTCDIVRPGGHVIVCALVERNEQEVKEITSGRRPSLLSLEHPPAKNIFADLGRVMSVSKGLLESWDRREGFTAPREQRRLALALERKFGRFAFPDDIADAFRGLRDRAWEKHEKDSDPGRIYRSIRQLRVRAAPQWAAEKVEIALIAILRDDAERAAEVEQISAELESIVKKINLPENYSWSDPPFALATASQFSALDIFETQALDFEYLCV